jgi:hypothetical protein
VHYPVIDLAASACCGVDDGRVTTVIGTTTPSNASSTVPKHHYVYHKPPIAIIPIMFNKKFIRVKLLTALTCIHSVLWTDVADVLFY